MFFQIYGETAGWQLLGWLLVFAGLVIMNEIARRSKWGGIACFLVLPAVLSVYFIAIYIGADVYKRQIVYDNLRTAFAS